jgi:hypothetical protein
VSVRRTSVLAVSDEQPQEPRPELDVRAYLWLPRVWVSVLVVLTVLSAVRVDVGSGWQVRVGATSVTALLLAVLWVPTVVRLLGLRGGTVTAGGLSLSLEAFRRIGTPEAGHREHAAGAAAAARARADADVETGTGAGAEVEGGTGDVTALGQRLDALAGDFEALHDRLGPSFERTAAMEGVLAEARLMAGRARALLDPRLATFDAAGDGERAVTVALVQGTASPLPPAVPGVLGRNLAHPRSPFEEYHLLRTLRDRWWDLPSQDREAVRRRVQRLVDAGSYDPGSDRLAVARRLLALPV